MPGKRSEAMAVKGIKDIVGEVRSGRSGGDASSGAVTAAPEATHSEPAASEPASTGQEKPAPAAKLATQGQPKTQTEPKVYTHDDAVRLNKALQSERGLREQAEKRAKDQTTEQLRGQLAKLEREFTEMRTPKEPPKEPPKDPAALDAEEFTALIGGTHAYKQKLREEMRNEFLAELDKREQAREQRETAARFKRSETAAMKIHEDYSDVIGSLKEVFAANPTLKAKVVQADDPAELGYQLAKDWQIAGGETSPSKLRDKYRSEFLEELKSKGVDTSALEAEQAADEGGGTVTQIRPTPTIAARRGSAVATGAQRDKQGRWKSIGSITEDLRSERASRRRA